MKVTTRKNHRVVVLGLSLLLLAIPSTINGQTTPETTTVRGEPVGPRSMQTLPNPVLVFMGQESYSTGGKDYIRYLFSVDNRDKYPQSLFEAAPQLPPCESNTKASRTWVDLYSQNGKRLNGFCALASPKDLSHLWFALEPDVVPPSWVYLEMTDRSTNVKYKSNLSETTQ
jgi:hypothetical protein